MPLVPLEAFYPVTGGLRSFRDGRLLSGVVQELPSSSPWSTRVEATTPVDPALGVTRRDASAGCSIGDGVWAAPAGAKYVATTGTDSGAGTIAAPWLTLAYALAHVVAGDTIVMRAGDYAPDWDQAPSNVTIQNYPAAVVWCDGSQVISSWTASGAQWYTSWNHIFDKSPTYSFGSSGADSGFVDTVNYPYAAYPDQVFYDGTLLTQVGPLTPGWVSIAASVTAGKFYYDEAALRLYIGSTPTGHEVRGSTIQQAMRCQGTGTTIRGIGFRRYAPSNPHPGVLNVLNATDCVLDKIVVEDIANRGLVVQYATNTILRDSSLRRCGNLCIGGQRNLGLLMDHILTEYGNSSHYNGAPSSGNIKLTRSQDVTFRDSECSNSVSTGLWFDETVWRMTIVSSTLKDNGNHGCSTEICSVVRWGDMVVTGNGGWGWKINDTDDVKGWNSTFAANGGAIWVPQDDRKDLTDAARGARDPYPEAGAPWTVRAPWTIQNVELRNMIFAHHPATGGEVAFVTMRDITNTQSAVAWGFSIDSSVYNRPTSATVPPQLMKYQSAAAVQSQYSSLALIQSSTTQEDNAVYVAGAEVVTVLGARSSAFPSETLATPLTAEIADLVGQQVATKHLGAWV